MEDVSHIREHAACPRCGYDLHGLRESRCPECGCHFSKEDISTPAIDFRTPWERSGGAAMPIGFFLTMASWAARPFSSLRRLASRRDVPLERPALFLAFVVATLLASLAQLYISQRWIVISKYGLNRPFLSVFSGGPGPILSSYGVAVVCGFFTSALAAVGLLQFLVDRRCRLLRGLSSVCLVSASLLSVIILTHLTEPVSDFLSGPRIIHLSRYIVVPIYGGVAVAALGVRLGQARWQQACALFVLGIVVFFLSYALVVGYVQSVTFRLLRELL